MFPCRPVAGAPSEVMPHNFNESSKQWRLVRPSLDLAGNHRQLLGFFAEWKLLIFLVPILHLTSGGRKILSLEIVCKPRKGPHHIHSQGPAHRAEILEAYREAKDTSFGA